MERHAFAMKVNEGKMNDFRQLIGKIWGELTAVLDKYEMHNFSIWNAADLIFGYYEKPDSNPLTADQASEIKAAFDQGSDSFQWLSSPLQEMRLMYEDFGVVRESKELIRHRMFMTKLKDGCAEEYKLRHDGLIEKRNGAITAGPDSNFSIWSDGTYIFGYDEIDTTMEKEPTPEDQEFTVSWETRQLGIMDWITNDVDWLTKEIHVQSVRLAWHA